MATIPKSTAPETQTKKTMRIATGQSDAVIPVDHEDQPSRQQPAAIHAPARLLNWMVFARPPFWRCSSTTFFTAGQHQRYRQFRAFFEPSSRAVGWEWISSLSSPVS